MTVQPTTPIVNFIVYDQNGRITETGAQERMFCDQRIKAGERLMYSSQYYGDAIALSRDRYVDTTAGAKVVRDRPEMDRDFDRDQMLPRQEATLKDVPACVVAFSGPVTGSQNHSNGDLSIGFTLPGIYQLTFEAFPYKAVGYTLKVVPLITVTKTATSVSV